ncbi:unnamed protein product [Trifolium pratense]|uniref:Uncharacterized protein n=1 Tax=Trifolium pratense TaxID=57577 RepID=A0ACB0IPA9_TRIPR|nr:unnamed protein product [Trifolium pratense]
MSKLILSMFLSALLICSTFTRDGEASTIDKYLVFPPQIRPPPGPRIPANPYTRDSHFRFPVLCRVHLLSVIAFNFIAGDICRGVLD